MAKGDKGQAGGARTFIDQRLTAAISHPLRVAILVECDRAPISPVEYVRRHGGNVTNVAYHFRKLEELGCLTLIGEVKRRGANEHIFAVTKRALITGTDFAQMPANIRGGFDAMIVNTFAERVIEANEAGTLENHPDHHLAWTPLRLDKAGVDRIMDKLGELFTLLGVEQLAARERIEESGEQPIHATVALFGFESPAPERDHDLSDGRR